MQNPLSPEHLTPYVDRTAPVVAGLLFRDGAGRVLSPRSLRGRVSIAALAYDRPTPPVGGSWYGFPVAPALVGWQLRRLPRGPIVAHRIVVDFRRTLPPRRDFWRVYAPGSYQNFPVLDGRFFYQRPGRFLFELTPRPLDTDRLPAGRYLARVWAEDTCGNRGTLVERVTVRSGA